MFNKLLTKPKKKNKTKKEQKRSRGWKVGVERRGGFAAQNNGLC